MAFAQESAMNGRWRSDTDMAETEYMAATSRAASTSHFKKLTPVYFFDNASKIGAIVWQGPHLFQVSAVLSQY